MDQKYSKLTAAATSSSPSTFSAASICRHRSCRRFVILSHRSISMSIFGSKGLLEAYLLPMGELLNGLMAGGCAHRVDFGKNLQMYSFYRAKSLAGRENLQLYRYFKLLWPRSGIWPKKNVFLQEFLCDGSINRKKMYKCMFFRGGVHCCSKAGQHDCSKAGRHNCSKAGRHNCSKLEQHDCSKAVTVRFFSIRGTVRFFRAGIGSIRYDAAKRVFILAQLYVRIVLCFPLPVKSIPAPANSGISGPVRSHYDKDVPIG